jgi:hypothetical protein
MSAHTCESCGMAIEAGPYCQYCVEKDGKLQAFEERFERMVQWQAKKEPAATRAALEKKTLAYMATMPAWKDHPRVKGAAGSVRG